MSVIGRLDGQVWEKLIAPIAKRHEREADEQEKQEAPRDEEAREKREEGGETV
jgi:hypothetical protein